MVDNLQLAIWLEYAENSIGRAHEKAKNPAVKRALNDELSELTKTIHELKSKITPTPIEQLIEKKK